MTGGRADLAALGTLALRERLTVMGVLATWPKDGIGSGTIALLGPAEPGFWTYFTTTPEFRDGTPDPVDRWSGRVITALAHEIGGAAYFPFGDPVRPFFSWALRSGRAWQSPVKLLVHDQAGLMVSYRGAVFLPVECPATPSGVKPCDSCADKPCAIACPAGALTTDGYDVSSCHAYLDTDEGRTNLLKGCAVRRACPVSKTYGRSEEQSAFHMKHFHP